jgi:predicted transposase YbfD/YdcC
MEKTNEIPTAQDLFIQMQLRGCIVAFDAMNTQKNTVSAITKSKGDYVGGLKGNQHTFYDEVVLFFTDDTLESIRKRKNGFRSYTEKAHNRIEKRSYYMTTDIKWFADLLLLRGSRPEAW